MKGYLLLANGQLYEGTLMGAAKPVMAELVFTTAMTGYLETLTDPSYEGEIVIQTFPTIGNYGVIPEDFESPRPRLSAYIVRELCDEPSNFRCQGKLDDYLKAQGIPCLTGVDTRALTRVIRNAGVMNAALLTEKPENPEEICAQLKVLPFHPSIQDVTCDGVQPAKKRGIHNVVLWDFGAKANIQRELEKRGCAVTVVPASATAQEILHLLAQANQRLPGQQRVHLLLQFGRKRLHARAVHHVAQPPRALRASKERRVPFRRNDSVEHLRPEFHQRQALALRRGNHPMRIQPRQIVRQKAIDVFRGQYFLCVCTAFHFPIPLPQPDTISE